MTSCTNCGNELGDGRFCTNCGHPVPPPTKLPPPAPADLPPSPRFPMYVDEVASVVRPPAPRAEPTAEIPVVAPPPRRSGTWVTWVAVGAVLLLLLVLGGWLATRSGGDGGSTATPANEPTRKPSSRPDEPGVVVPATAPPNQDVDGNPVRYDGENMLDGDPTTAWRMPGDGTGSEITVTLPGETRLRSVGIINGYAKTEDVDWYHGNRRVLQVEWVFDDGSSVVQNLDDTTELQSVDVDATTTHVVVRLREVSPPGKGKTARDYTAISELSLESR